MDLNLRGRRALVTAGSKGIGHAIATSLAAEGRDLHLAARTQSELDKVAADLLPMKRAALPAEVSALVAFLCSDHASSISGSAVTVDGGLSSEAAIGVKRG